MSWTCDEPDEQPAYLYSFFADLLEFGTRRSQPPVFLGPPIPTRPLFRPSLGDGGKARQLEALLALVFRTSQVAVPKLLTEARAGVGTMHCWFAKYHYRALAVVQDIAGGAAHCATCTPILGH